MKARVIEERCIGCGLCVNVCPQHAIELVGEKRCHYNTHHNHQCQKKLS